jgi:hypothetical protein
MPGHLPTQTESAQPDYANLKRLAKEKNRGLLGTEVTCNSGNKTMKWKVISEHEPEEVCTLLTSILRNTIKKKYNLACF